MKPILFSTTFPAYHPKKGQPTYFVEKIWAHLIYTGQFSWDDCEKYTKHLRQSGYLLCSTEKVFELYRNKDFKAHTIRQGFSRAKDDIFSPRIWSGKPYRSKQIAFAPPLHIYHVPMLFKDTLDRGEVFLKNGQWMSDVALQNLAQNDGLSLEDFKAWFNKPTFTGQIIYF